MTTKSDKKLEILEDFYNEVGHALLDYYDDFAIDYIHRQQIQKEAMDKIKMADDKATRLLEGLTLDRKT